MRSFVTFMKKEMTEQLRSGKLMILGILFVLFGIMNPENRDTSPAIAVASRDEVTEGAAPIISTLRNVKTARYKVEISDIGGT